jgi:hypothetical protein
MQQDYYSALASIIMASARNNAQLRRTIYELARSKLRQQLHRAQELDPSERALRLRALESAIEKIEAELAENNAGSTYPRADVLTTVPDSRVEIIPPARRPPSLSDTRDEFAAIQTARARSPIIRTALALIAAAILVGVTYIVVEREPYKEPQSKPAVDQNISRNSNRKSSSPNPNIPIPAAYGVYALTDGQLTELQPLPIRTPDQRVAISGIVSFPSAAKLPDGRVQFVVFRRDLVNNAPEKAVVRVVAQVVSAAAFADKGGATTRNLASSWAVRSRSYEMKVAPIDGKPAMILIRPAEADFSFPPGRYALVVKTVAYDFSVNGPITDPVQCVQRSDETDAPVFTECPTR